MTMTISELRELPASERLLLVAGLWDSLAGEDADISLTDQQFAELGRRRAELESEPTKGITWAIARERLRADKR